MTIDINCDIGESFGNYRFGDDSQIMSYLSSCNVACGFHAGDPVVIEHTLKNAIENNLAIGAHPSYPDLQGFGRRTMNIPPGELISILSYQICALKGMTEILGGKLRHVKPHGALYNDMSDMEELSTLVIETVGRIDPELKLVGLPDSVTEYLCKQKGIEFIGEFFADRNYNNNGRLVPRSEMNATLSDPVLIAQRVLDFLQNKKVQTINQHSINLDAQTICIHGDHPKALLIAQQIGKVLGDNNVEIQCPQ